MIQNVNYVEPRTKNIILIYLLHAQYMHRLRLLFTSTVRDFFRY